MTTEVTQFDVAFDKLKFKRETNNLVVSTKGEILTTYENFFNGTQPGTVSTIETKDNSSGYTSHTLITDAMIEVDNLAEYQGYNVVDGAIITGYNEKIKVKYDGQTHAPEGQSEGYDSVIYGNYGNDIVYGGSKSDWLQGSQGNDIIYGGSGGEDMLSGDMGNDKLVAGSVNSKGKITYNKKGVQLYGADGNDKITGGKGNDFIWGGTGNDTLTGKGGANSFVFVESDFGDDTITDATKKDELRFVVNYGSSTTPDYSGYNFSDLVFNKEENNLVITATNDDTDNTVTIKNYFKQKSRVDKIYALNESGTPENYSITKDATIHVTMDHDRSYSGRNGNEEISAEHYVSANGKSGVKIKVGKGDDVITGSLYNDSIKSGGGDNTVTEYGGKNKIKLGKGDDTVLAAEYSSNNINAGSGDNTVYLESYGNNKVKTGKGDDTIEIMSGTNKVNAGNGENNITVSNSSINNIKTGKNNDEFTINSGNNKIKSGAGKDSFEISGGYNTINTGKGESVVNITDGSQNDITGGNKTDSYSIEEGTNNISAKSGDDNFEVSGGTNILYGGKGNDTFEVSGGSNTLYGGKGNDIYNFSEFDDLLTEGTVIINDKYGKNVINLSNTYTTDDVSIYVDVSLNSKHKAKLNGTWSITSSENTDGNIEGITVNSGKKPSMTLSIDDKNYTVTKTVLSEIASSVATWLVNNDYMTTTDVFNSNNTDDITSLIAVYNTASEKFFGG